jgi:L-ascorbate metabolism protein UlaG (beta-lactamase superfamily)
MKRTISFFILIIMVLVLGAGCAPAATAVPTAVPTIVPPTATPIPASPTPSPLEAVKKLNWFGTSAILYNGSKVIYFDPVTLGGNLPKADLILVTHAHSDHWSVADIQKIISPNTTLIIGTNVVQAYETSKADLGIAATVLNEGDKTDVDGVSIEAVPAFDTTFHQKGTGGVGFLVNVDGLVLYMAGGTDAYPEMANYTSDIAFIPVYSKNKAQVLAEVIPAKVIVLEHTSYYAAKAVADLFTQDFGGKKSFSALEVGPYNP